MWIIRVLNRAVAATLGLERFGVELAEAAMRGLEQGAAETTGALSANESDGAAHAMPSEHNELREAERLQLRRRGASAPAV